MPRSVVLLSAGLDSAVNLKCALDRGGVVALTFNYGQQAARRENEAAAAMCARYGLHHEVVRLPWLAAITKTALVVKNRSLPCPDVSRLDDCSGRKAAERVWVPNRNGIFLAVAAGFAESFGANEIVPGFNAEEAASFPDNSAEFIQAVNRSLRLSTLNRVRVRCYTARKRKPAIVRLGLRIDAPLDLIWSCYQGGRRMCGKCESCLRLVRAVEEAHCAAWFRKRHERLPPQLKQPSGVSDQPSA